MEILNWLEREEGGLKSIWATRETRCPQCGHAPNKKTREKLKWGYRWKCPRCGFRSAFYLWWEQ